MSRLKLFITNIVVYGLGGVLSKVIPFVLLPLITRLLPDISLFGLYDLTVIILSVGTYITLMGMYDAMFRLFFEKNDDNYKKEICSTTLMFVFCNATIITVVLIVFRYYLSNALLGSKEYSFLIVIVAINIFFSSINAIIALPTRLQNKRRIYLATNMITPIISYSISIPLLLMGYYTVALPLASVSSVIAMTIIFWNFNHKWFRLTWFRMKYLKPLLEIGLPLVPTFLIYWVFNSADKIIITQLLGDKQLGIYAIGGKIGQISQLIYTAFAGGWQYFAFSTMNDTDQVNMTSSIFEYLACLTYIASLCMMTFNEFIFKILFTGDYISGSVVAPYLFIAPLLLMLFQVGGNQFLVIKRTWYISIILIGGAILNIFLNLLLIPILGIEGAAIATLIGYIFAVIVAVIILRKMHLLLLGGKFYILTFIFIGILAIWRIRLQDEILLMLILNLIFTCSIVFCYKEQLVSLFDMLKRKTKDEGEN